MQTHPVAIIGGGPAGAHAASLLTNGGADVLLFDEKLAWEKPCGGGLTYKALQQYPFLADSTAEINSADCCELFSPSGRSVRLKLQHAVAIYSRVDLNGLLLGRARRAGARIRQERVIRIERPENENWRIVTLDGTYDASHVILAAGARSTFRGQFSSPISQDDLMVTAGYFIPGFRPLMQIQFLHQITGYIWVFPRKNHVSAGIAAKMGEIPTTELRRILESWLAENKFCLDNARFYSHILPSLRPETFENLEVCGQGWTLIGDCAGLVDPITGEGLYYALRSAELCATALLAQQPHHYRALLEDEVLPELKLAARVSQRFYRGRVFGESVLEQMVSLTASSSSFRELMSDLFAGIQGYRDLRARLYRILPSVMTEGLASKLKSPWNKNSGEMAFAADLIEY